MSVPRELATGLGGAIGCDYRRDPNYLILVEFDGKISRVDLVRALDHVVFSGTATMPADSSLDLTNGTSAQGGDIRWDHTDPSGGRVMRPQGNCELANLGVINYNSITHATLQDLAYSNALIHGDAGPSNQLVTGDVFGVHNRFVQSAADFDYATKVLPVIREAVPLVASGALFVPVAAVFELDDIQAAIQQVLRGGKVLLKVVQSSALHV